MGEGSILKKGNLVGWGNLGFDLAAQVELIKRIEPTDESPFVPLINGILANQNKEPFPLLNRGERSSDTYAEET